MRPAWVGVASNATDVRLRGQPAPTPNPDPNPDSESEPEPEPEPDPDPDPNPDPNPNPHPNQVLIDPRDVPALEAGQHWTRGQPLPEALREETGADFAADAWRPRIMEVSLQVG